MVEEVRQPEQQTPEPTEDFLKPEQLFRTIGKIRKDAPPLTPLWGYFLFKKAITSIVGDPGIGKTSFGYGLAKELCLGNSFLDVPTEEPVNSLYMDFESADSLVASRASLVFGDTEVPNFWIYNTSDYYLPQVAKVTLEFCNKRDINLIFVDNQSMAFNTRDENDNAEAIRQMRFLRSFAVACNCALLSFHHTSKANLSGTRKGSGAYARARLADVCINLETPSEDHPDTLKLEVSKNRFVDEKVLWYFKKEEGKFVFTGPPLGVIGKPTDTQIYKAQHNLLEFCQAGKEYETKNLVSIIGVDGLTYDIIDKALRRLVQQGRFIKPKYGYYEKVAINLPYMSTRMGIEGFGSEI